MASRGGQKGAGVFLTRRLNVQRRGEVTLLDAVWQGTPSGARAEMFFKSNAPLERVAAGKGWKIVTFRTIGGAPVIVAEGPGPADGPGRVPLVLDGQARRFEARPDETHLFAGMNVGLALRNGETPGQVARWLEYHVSRHGMEAALIVNRARAGQDEAFMDGIRKAVRNLPGLRRLVVVESDAPLGREELPAEGHPFNAPEAPGKDRMEVPPPDPWRAPLGEIVLYEIARARFLARARAVMNIDVCDLLPPEVAPNVFDRAVASATGCIALEGRHCYPWRVRKGARPDFGDHICRPFDSRKVRRRWCVAPQVAPGGCVWRLIRVVGTAPGPGESLPFNRYMALRHPVEQVSKIVPKTSLVEDAELLEQATGLFGHKPVRMPRQALNAVPAAAGTRTTIVTTMKNEGPFILEWLAYHRMIGVTDFLIYTNDCTDGTDTMLELLQRKGLVQHRENPFRQTPGLKPQHAALQAADKEEIVRASDWLICMDVDEFINIKVGKGRLEDLFGAVGDANMISLTWRLFGNSDIEEYRDEFIVGQFTRCAPELIRKPHQAWGFKTLFRNLGIFKKLGVHRPKGLHPQLVDRIRWVNGSGRPMPERMYRNAWRSTLDTYGYDLVALNHYAVRSAESFLVKRDRGRVNHVERDQGLSYWFRMNNNAEEDRSIQRMIPALREEYARLMADPEIRAAHEHSVARHREKIEELKAREDYSAFYRELTSPRMRKLSRLHSHFGANVFLSGPQVIPDEIVEKDPAEPFVFTVERGRTTH